MNGTSSTWVARRLALAATLLVAVGSTAQAYTWPTPNQAQATVFAPGLPGQTVAVFVTVLGGVGVSKSQLIFFNNGISNPGTNIGPQGPGTNPWVAAPNSTFLGFFQAGDELIFGDHWKFPASTGIVYSGDPNRNPLHSINLNNWGNSTVPEDNGVTPFPGTPNAGTTYGFEDEARPGDYNDLLFTITANATPEPASMVLLASGIVGVIGAGVIRRRRKV